MSAADASRLLLYTLTGHAAGSVDPLPGRGTPAAASRRTKVARRIIPV